MTRFVRTSKGYIPLNRIQLVQPTKSAIRKIIVDDEVIDESKDFDNIVISMTPVQGEWECLLSCKEDNGPDSIIAYPVIAWGLTVFGSVIPIATCDMGDVDWERGKYALRKVGNSQVYDELGNNYSTVNEWMESCLEQGSQLKAIK